MFLKLPRKGMGKFASAIIGLVGIIMWWGAIPIQNQVLGQHWGLNYLYFYKFKEKLKARALPAIDKRFVFSKGDSYCQLQPLHTQVDFMTDPLA